MSNPRISVLIVNWNGQHHLEICLPSLLATRYPNFDVMLLDNGSTDGSTMWVQQNFATVHIVSLGNNQGFAAANNVGLRQAITNNTDYVALLNNDTRVDSDWLSALVTAAEQDPQIAICQARQRTWDDQQEIRFRFIPEWAEARQVRLPIAPSGPATQVPFASGCAMLLRCSALKQIGLFDERYFMYVEDVDLTLRAWIHGFQAVDVSEAIVYHRMSGSSSKQGSRQRSFWGYRNQLTTLLKLYEIETLRRFAKPISKRWFCTHNRIALRGTIASLMMVRDTLEKRRQIQRRRIVPDSCFLRLCES